MESIGIKHENLDFKIYKSLKAMIVAGKLKAGEKIYQDKIASQLGVSRTPLMHALKKLEQEKLITAVPRRGFYVREVTKSEMIQIFELREVLEGLAARRAAKNITDKQISKLRGYFKDKSLWKDKKNIKKYAEEDRKFHNFIVEINGKTPLADIWEDYNIMTFSYQLIDMEGLLRPPAETINEHLQMIESLCNRDPERSEMLAKEHLRSSREALITD